MSGEWMDKPLLIFVDDEKSVLNALRRGLRCGADDWQMEFFSSPVQALQRIQEHKPWVVVTDQRMPEMRGTELLKEVSRLAPDAVRIILTGYTSTEVAMQAAEVSHLLIAKPFVIEELLETLQRAVCLHTLPISDDLRARLGAMETLPVLPQIYQQLTDYLKREDAELKQVAEIVSHDPAILAKLMQLANSAFMGYSTRVRTPLDAIVRLGMEMVKNLVLCVGVFRQCDRLDQSELDRLLKEALDVAALSRQFSLACGCSRDDVEQSFMLGLLHTMGELMLRLADIPVLQETDPAAETLVQSDLAGGFLLSLWQFDQELVDAIMYQSAPQLSPEPSALLGRLHVARCAYQTHQQGLDLTASDAGLQTELLASLGLLSEVEQWQPSWDGM